MDREPRQLGVIGALGVLVCLNIVLLGHLGPVVQAVGWTVALVVGLFGLRLLRWISAWRWRRGARRTE